MLVFRDEEITLGNIIHEGKIHLVMGCDPYCADFCYIFLVSSINKDSIVVSIDALRFFKSKLLFKMMLVISVNYMCHCKFLACNQLAVDLKIFIVVNRNFHKRRVIFSHKIYIKY